jgi:hypothetical protein
MNTTFRRNLQQFGLRINKEARKPGTGFASASWFPGFLIQPSNTSTAAGRHGVATAEDPDR